MFRCNKCEAEKLEIEYYHTTKRGKPYTIPTCKNCLSKNRNTKKKEVHQTESLCSLCLETKPINEFIKDRYSNRGFTSQCKKCRNKYKKQYTSSEKGINTRIKYQSSKYYGDNEYRLLCNIRSRINSALKASKQLKNNKTVQILGCSIKEYKIYFESLFKYGMSWENRSLWHIDHIKPVDSFDLSNPNEILQCFHYSNTRPLWANENFTKSNKF